MSDFTTALAATVASRAARLAVKAEALRRLPHTGSRCACTASLYTSRAGYGVVYNAGTAGFEANLRDYAAKNKRQIIETTNPADVAPGWYVFTVDANQNGKPDHVWIVAGPPEYYKGYWRAACADNQAGWGLHWRNLSHVRGGKGAMRYALCVGERR